MIDIHTILADHIPKANPEAEKERVGGAGHKKLASVSEIPDLFFDEILVDYKLNRIEVMVLMYLYRLVWCRPNLYKEFGISQLLSHTEMAKMLKIDIDDIYNSLRKLEDLGFVSTIRSGQYFVRKYFSKENDEKYSQSYDSFEI